MKSKWIHLPIEFNGIWINSDYGGWSVTFRERFDPNLSFEKVSRFSKPKWVSREELEERYGRVEMVIVDDEKWNSNYDDTPD
jgi:hypothetical protein